jgi:hypothetical protein
MPSIMTNTQIIEKIAQEKKVEELIKNISKQPDLTQNHLDDLSQDIYIQLLEKPPTLIQSLYEKNELHYYIARMLVNNIHSTLSPYYYKYIKPEIHDTIDIDINDQDT